LLGSECTSVEFEYKNMTDAHHCSLSSTHAPVITKQLLLDAQETQIVLIILITV